VVVVLIGESVFFPFVSHGGIESAHVGGHPGVHFIVSHLWSLWDGARWVGSSARCFSSGELLLETVMTASSPGKGTM
jgi:hypothetical protein